ncbi:trk system potassium uptake protein TrkH [Clostridium collagenovorans DSM 3089]|uniref:Trk system potassium uptake protein TrkH n=1 Tax=Clostridium collagenovorans DSM 3089 TaxID=1121306 RepID=A0A1M5VRZ5_9CLOT|nr:TrkH family potassium uptake protein [Clostridium collagenovorans]SHH77960.1 trk system potassium uptake protein TrkH [Clostridium collagenovorans DSM 3089]
MKYEKFKSHIRLKPVQILALGFAFVIFIGACLLSLPISSAAGVSTNFLDSLFTSTSAVCVTGLVTLDTGTYWSLFGQVIIMLLIEIGGLGFMSFATLIFLLLGKKITLKERLVMQEAMNSFSLQGIVKMARYILGFTFSVQAVGALLLSTQFIPDFGFKKGLFYGVFHSISGFCNAGFDLMGNFNSVTAYSGNAVVILTLSALIVIGGLGFCVWIEVYNYRMNRKLSLNSKIVLLMTAILIVGGTILMYLFEMKNPATLYGRPASEQFLSATFAAISPRTAGFNSIPLADMTLAGKFLTIVLMFIGGSSGSTAGGLKVTTTGILIIAVISVIKGREDAEIFKKRLPKELVYKAFAIFAISLILVISVTMVLSIVESQASLEYLLFEATSAYGTVGLTLGLTQQLGVVGKIIISLTMYAGRVGPMTLALALGKRGSRSVAIKYPEDKIMVG